jgi:hypothetical protein
MDKMIYMKYIACSRLSKLKQNIFVCQKTYLLTIVDLWDYEYQNQHVKIFSCRKIRTISIWITDVQDIWWVINSNSPLSNRGMSDMWYSEMMPQKKVKGISNIEHVLPIDYFKYKFLSISHLCIGVIELFLSRYIAW